MKKSSLPKIWIDWGRVFHDINLKNNGAIVILRFLLYVVKFARVLVTYVKHLLMSALASLERNGEEDLVFVNWRSCRHCLQNEWPLAKKSIAQTMNSLHKIFEPIVLGVLPGSIGIGAGVMMDYSTPSSASISTATSERSDKYLCPCP